MTFYLNKAAPSLVNDIVLRLVKVALSCQSGEDLDISKKKTDVILKEMSKVMLSHSPLCIILWSKVDKEITALVNKKCDPRYLSVILHARYRVKLYKRSAEKRLNTCHLTSDK